MRSSTVFYEAIVLLGDFSQATVTLFQASEKPHLFSWNIDGIRHNSFFSKTGLNNVWLLFGSTFYNLFSKLLHKDV